MTLTATSTKALACERHPLIGVRGRGRVSKTTVPSAAIPFTATPNVYTGTALAHNRAAAATAPLTSVSVGLGWDARRTAGPDYDLDLSAVLLPTHRMNSDAHDLVFYDKLRSTHGLVQHSGDHQRGGSAGDDEQINVELATLADNVEKIAFLVTMKDALAHQLFFGQVPQAYVRLCNQASGQELVRFDLTEDAKGEQGFHFGDLFRTNGQWKFRIMGTGENADLEFVVSSFGVPVSTFFLP